MKKGDIILQFNLLARKMMFKWFHFKNGKLNARFLTLMHN